MEVQLDFSVDYASGGFDQAGWFVVRFSLADNLFERCAGENGERGLMNDLIPRVEFRHDEVGSRPISQHVMRMGVVIRPEPGERGQ